MTDILSLLPEELENEICAAGFPKYRSTQVVSWLSKGVRDFSLMKNLPADLKGMLKENYSIYKPEVLSRSESADGTVKYLWGLSDGNAVETVLMKYSYGNTVCISSQVGCRQGCRFCASTIGGLIRNLNPSEMLDEVLFTQLDSGDKISNIVLMGIGEPLDNYDNVMRFLKLVNHPQLMNIGMRHISLSTCGILPKIDELAALDLQLTLSVSLHAPDDETRSQIMPSNRNAGVENLISTCEAYYNKTGRRISFEYAMISGVNDSDEHAMKLAGLARRVHAHINLIPLNDVEERPFKASPPDKVKHFAALLSEKGANVTVRRSLGGDVNASCGQLRRNFMKNS